MAQRVIPVAKVRVFAGKQESPYRQAAREFVKNRGAVIGLLVFLLVVTSAIFAPALTPYDPLQIDAQARLLSPCAEYLMGTDPLGRDVLSRVLYAGRASLQVGIIPVMVSLVIGTSLGLVSGYFGGRLDSIIMRSMDVILAFPGIIFAIWLVGMLGPSLKNVIIAISLWSVPMYARLARGNTLSERELDYVLAERCIGAGWFRILMGHIFPNVTAPLIVMGTLNISSAIITGASLSFLGLGVRPPTPEWGAMLSDGRAYLSIAWWVAFFPGIVITTVVVAANLMGDGLRDALDPKVRGVR